MGSSQKDKAAEKAQMLLKVFNNLQSIELERGGEEGRGGGEGHLKATGLIIEHVKRTS